LFSEDKVNLFYKIYAKR